MYNLYFFKVFYYVQFNVFFIFISTEKHRIISVIEYELQTTVLIEHCHKHVHSYINKVYNYIRKVYPRKWLYFLSFLKDYTYILQLESQENPKSLLSTPFGVLSLRNIFCLYIL